MQQLHVALLVSISLLLAAPAAAAPDADDRSVVIGNASDLQQQCAAPATAFTAKYLIADDGDAPHLENVREVIELLGYTRTDNPADANLIWAWRDPFFKPADAEAHRKLTATHEHLRHLTQYQFVNQMPGQGYLATKRELAKLSAQLDGLPRTFKLPQEFAEFQAFVASEAGAGMEWIQKDPKHRGISIIQDPTASSLKELQQPLLVQQLVRPFLIDGKLWDVGVYVAVTSLEPLLAYIHTGGVLLRFCSEEYVRDITPDTRTSSYVITGLNDYRPAMLVEGMKAHFADAGADTEFGTTMALPALRSYLEANGVDTRTWWLDVQATIVKVLQAQNPKMRALQATHYTGQRTNFFTLLRFDFMLDQNANSYLIEANISPGLWRPDAPLDQQLLSRRLIHDLLALKGLAPGGHLHQFTDKGLLDLTAHPDAIALGEPACASCATAAQCNTDARCMLCRACRSEWQNGVLQRVAAEHLGSHGFMRMHPPHEELVRHMQQQQQQQGSPSPQASFSSEVEGRPDDTLVRNWLASKCKQDFRWC